MPTLMEMFADAGLEVVDKRPTLPRNAKQPWFYRELRQVRGAVIHHAAGSIWATAEGINALHQRIANPPWYPWGWPGIAYTFYVRPRSREEPRRFVVDFCHQLREWGPQAAGVNAETFGVCLAGNYVRERPDLRMVGALVTLVQVLQNFFVNEVGGGSLWVKPHNQVSKTLCPGLAWAAYLAAIGAA